MRLGLVTGNRHKLEELSLVLRDYGVELYMLDTPKIEVQSNSLEVIALGAARKAYSRTRVPLIVDDSGLFIEALRGFPGPYSSYVYKTIGVEGILRLLRGVPDRRACFHAVIAAIVPPYEKVFHARSCGFITESPRGAGGFGFDPIFAPEEGDGRTFAEMSIEEKNRYSHRAKAARMLGVWLREAFKRRVGSSKHL